MKSSPDALVKLMSVLFGDAHGDSRQGSQW